MFLFYPLLFVDIINKLILINLKIMDTLNNDFFKHQIAISKGIKIHKQIH